MKYKSQVYSHCIAYIILYVLMCHSAMCQLIRQEDMCYTVNCTTACANSCVNSSWTNCSVKCCNMTGCLNDTFVSMMMETITGEQRHRSRLQSCLSHAVIIFFIIISQYLQVFHVCVFGYFSSFPLNGCRRGNFKCSRHYTSYHQCKTYHGQCK